MICKKYAGGAQQTQSFTYSLIFPDELDDKENLAKAINALTQAQKNLISAFLADNSNGESEAKKSYEQAEHDLKEILNKPNILVFNWSDGRNANIGEDGTGNTLKGNKTQNGYTVVSGLKIEKFDYKCDSLKEYMKIFGTNSKLVTMTMSTNKLFYKVEEDAFASLEAKIKIADSGKLQALKKFLNGKTLNAMLKSASSLSSQGYLTLLPKLMPRT